MRACPTKATFKRESDGIVFMDFHRCIGCRFCMAACPFGARSFNFRDPRPFIAEINPEFPTRMKGVVEKCNFCAERLAEGQMPAVVTIGNSDNLKSGETDKAIAQLEKVVEQNPGLNSAVMVLAATYENEDRATDACLLFLVARPSWKLSGQSLSCA